MELNTNRAAQLALTPRAFNSYEGAVLYFNLGYLSFPCTHCHALHWSIETTTNRSINNGRYESCCKKGSIVLPFFRSVPPPLAMLLRSPAAAAKAFRLNIRRYNSALTFTSMIYRKDDRKELKRGPSGFQIHGELYHVQGPLISSASFAPRYAQLYFYDGDYASHLRHTRHSTLDPALLADQHSMLQNVNPFIAYYQTAAERLREMNRSGRLVLSPQLLFVEESGADPRRENLPVANEVAVIISDESEDSNSRDIVLAYRDSHGPGTALQYIHPDHAAYMPLHYVLLFPYGDTGFHWALKLHNLPPNRHRERLSQRAFYRYHLHTRLSTSQDLFLGCRLFQQYVVDAWASCDQNKLDWLRNNQKTFRSDLYNGLSDVVLRTDVNVSNIGRRIVLPSSYTGGDRYMMQLYQDSMALVRHFGRPTLCITFTANPQWPEIQNSLLYDQTAWDHPDLVFRVFRLKLLMFLREIKQDQIFGRFAAWVWTIEYQKRGLPHLHLLLFLHPEDRFLDSHRIDEIVSAEFPSPASDPNGDLTELLKTTMVHEPCGKWNPHIPCIKNKKRLGSEKCSKGYPHEWQAETMVREDGYPLYRR